MYRIRKLMHYYSFEVKHECVSKKKEEKSEEKF